MDRQKDRRTDRQTDKLQRIMLPSEGRVSQQLGYFASSNSWYTAIYLVYYRCGGDRAQVAG